MASCDHSVTTDPKVPGLQLRTLPSGKSFWYLYYRDRHGKQRKPANDDAEPDFLPPVDDDNDHLVARANADRRKGAQERRIPVSDRRALTGRRASEYAPLRDEGARRQMSDDGKRGPLLLVGALLIVVVFAVVVWNAYRDGLQGDEVEVAPELSTAGAFKTPPRVIEPSATTRACLAASRSEARTSWPTCTHHCSSWPCSGERISVISCSGSDRSLSRRESIQRIEFQRLPIVMHPRPHL